MCESCRQRSDRGAVLRLVEQCLSGLGVLRPEHCRAKGGAPKAATKAAVVNFQSIYAALEEALASDLHEEGGVVAWDDYGLKAAAAEFERSLEAELIRAMEEAIDAGLADVAQDLHQPDIVFTKMDPAIVGNLEAQSVSLCAKTAARVHGDIQAQLLEAQRLGENMHQAMERIKSISSLSDYEIERICRTELAKAANAARLDGYKGRVDQVEWVLGPAYNGNCACGDLAGEYSVEDAQRLQMPLHPNCDCYWVAVVNL